ncbi:hypothetical protein G3M48_007491 [Beauveria asiatica]|uniref:Uncharacterized protein n=1 Tax=Beauveria asiatica TaxID=1069075 RepID=A0AAW0RM22_9HYPO
MSGTGDTPRDYGHGVGALHGNHHRAQQHFEFVAVSGPSRGSQQKKRQIPKIVRTQVMRDYVQKRDGQIVNHDGKQVARHGVAKPSDLKGRFRLNASVRDTAQETNTEIGAMSLSQNSEIALPDNCRATVSTSPVTILGVSFDPFDAYELRLSPESMRLIHHYYYGCSMSLAAYNIGGSECLTCARTNPALFHSILYVVSLFYNLTENPKDKSGSLFHAIEAFRAINDQLEKGTFADTTIAAVALLATKESLDGDFEGSIAHMNGLQTMVERRGGIRHMQGQGKAAQWYVNTKLPHRLNSPSILIFPTERSDLCYSSMWGLPPRFLPWSTTTAYVERPPEHGRVLIDPRHAFGAGEPVISVINFLRHVSRTIHEKKDVDLRRLNLSQELYDVEYQLQAVKTDTASPTRPPEIMPLSVALHLYLYLVIRNIPIQTRLISALAKRVRAALETQATFWVWSNSSEFGEALVRGEDGAVASYLHGHGHGFRI